MMINTQPFGHWKSNANFLTETTLTDLSVQRVLYLQVRI